MQRVESLLEQMTLTEKLAQLVGVWVGASADGGGVAPLQDQVPGQAEGGEQRSFEELAADGLGHLTRVFGTRPVEPEAGRRALREAQRFLVEQTRLGIPAIAHEECLTGLAAWRATTYPSPIAWAATFDEPLVEQMAAAIGSTMADLEVHQGLAPVLDVVRDARWGRVEECLGEDPYLVGSLGTAYVRGLQSAGIVATLKHFVGYSASEAGRNLAPAHVGPRELADVLLVPFEMAVLDGGVRSVMHSYAEIDGLPVAADRSLLTGLLRDRWGFDGVVVADYFGVAFLHALHGTAEDLGAAAAMALHAGVDVELPSGDAYLEPLRTRVEKGEVPEHEVDQAVRRVLHQKAELGLLDPAYATTAGERAASGQVAPDLDPPEHRAIAARLAERSVVLVSNDGTLPLGSPERLALIGPNADRVEALFGCYSFLNHVLPQHPGVEPGIAVATVREALAAELPGTRVETVPGCAVDDTDRSGLPEAVEAATAAEVAVVVLGDHAALFGRGTVGEGCDAEDLELPGQQRALLEAVLETGTPVVLVLLTGRPYAVGWALERCAAVVQAFFPGEEGAQAVAGVLGGRVNPSGRLPVSLPGTSGVHPSSYLHARLAGSSPVSNLDPSPAAVFGSGLSYTRFERTELDLEAAQVATDGTVVATVRVANVGPRAGADVVQLYGHDVAASTTRPVAQLLGYARVELETGASAGVRFEVPTTRLGLTDASMRRVVEPGRVELWVGTPEHRETEIGLDLVGPRHVLTTADPRLVRTTTDLEESP